MLVMVVLIIAELTVGTDLGEVIDKDGEVMDRRMFLRDARESIKASRRHTGNASRRRM